ncbi:retrovirus-related Pol polyprotein from transposon 17.6 [Trichonephila clavipes]|uniref:RNA-directed DNA polymerase n=1 Tax=Trichonephila clavipes TaxID=2585209 RepID=A0A8X6R3N3_TRICX|nr:retrovirus-related Pol polyprotein from transposon 17.6 [Trichonephila clavipes]
MEDAKQKQKLWYDSRTVKRQFQPGELVFIIAPSRPNKLSVQWVGLGEIVQQLSETNYVVKFPEKDKTHVYHVNMLKPYHQREENINFFCINPLKHDEEDEMPSLELENESNLFSNVPGCTDLAEHDIELESERAIVAKPYRMSPRQIEILKSEVNEMLELKIIEPGESDFTSPLILVEAQGKEARPYIDYRRLNKVTRTQFFPLSNIEELLEKVLAAKYISILDLIRSLKNAPNDFSRLMANLLRNCEDFAVPYLDDIAIFSLAWDDHLKHLKDVFDRLRSAKLHIKPSKCQFAQAFVKYLGHLTQVRDFLGLSGYYRRYIPEFSVIAAPLTDLLKGRNRKSTVDWNRSCQNAFKELKTRLSKNPVLYSPDFTKPFIIQCDASNLGIGVVLSQVCENEEHPIMLLSKKPSLAEQKYSTTEKEWAAIIFAVQKLKCYLDGHQKFLIQTDHNPLVWLEKNTGTNPRLLRWALILQSFNYEIAYWKGKQNQRMLIV